MATKRTYLGGHRPLGVFIDMEEVYRKKDSGMTLKDIADELGVSRSTLYKRHYKYQKELEILERAGVDIQSLNPNEVDACCIKVKNKSSNRNYVPLPKEYQ